MVVNVDLYSGIITKVSNALNTLVSREKPGFQALSKVLIAYPCTEPRQTRYRQHCLVLSCLAGGVNWALLPQRHPCFIITWQQFNTLRNVRGKRVLTLKTFSNYAALPPPLRRHYVFRLSARLCVRACARALGGGIFRPAYRQILVSVSNVGNNDKHHSCKNVGEKK